VDYHSLQEHQVLQVQMVLQVLQVQVVLQQPQVQQVLQELVVQQEQAAQLE
jgi:hypothetical protein